MVASVPFAGWSLFNIGNAFSFTASYVIGVLTLILSFPRLLIPPRVESQRHFFILYAPLIFACFLSALPLIFWNYANEWQYLLSLLHLCFFIAVTYCLIQVKDTEKALDFYAISYTLISLIVTVIGLVDLTLVLISGSGLGIEFNTVVRTAPSTSTIGLLPRASSIFFEPGWFAHYLLIDIIVVVVWLLPRAISTRNWGRVWLLRGCVLLMLLALIATLSAATYLVASIIMLFYILNRPHPLKVLTSIALILLILALVPFPYDLPNPIVATFERFIGIVTGVPVAGESIGARSDELDAAFQMFTNTVFLGSGYGQSTYYIMSVKNVASGGISSFYGILMAETGIVGLLAFVFSIVTLNYKLWRLQKALSNNDASRAQIVFCARCVILAETVYLNFFSAMASPIYVCSFWFALLLLTAWRPLYHQLPSRQTSIKKTL